MRVDESSASTRGVRASPSSYWAATARDFVSGNPITSDIETDVAIVGAGFTGLSAGYHLQQTGRSCVVLDANGPGWGASGRNGGIAVPRYKPTFPALAKQYGEDVAIAMYRLAHEAVDTLERVVAESGIACRFARHGHITPVVHETDVDRFAEDLEWLARVVGDTAPRMLGRDEVRRRTGTSFYMDGYFEPRGAAIHPLAYSRGLAAALVGKGVPIFTGTPVLRWREDEGALILDCGRARVKARELILATNGYTDLSRAGNRLKRRVVPFVSSMIGTEPLPDHLIREILPERHVVTDAKRLTNYFRVVEESRLLFGGRGGASNRESPPIYGRLKRQMVEIYPQLRGIRIEFGWSGRVAVTLDSLPHLGRLARNVHYAMGYNGRGVALGCYLGKMLARAVCGDAVELGPITSSPFNAFPFHRLRVPAKQAAIVWYGLLDRLR